MAEAKVAQKVIRIVTLTLEEGEAYELLRCLDGAGIRQAEKVKPTRDALRRVLYPACEAA